MSVVTHLLEMLLILVNELLHQQSILLLTGLLTSEKGQND